MKKIIALILMLMLLASSAMAEGLVFTTVDMEGNEVTEEIFAPYDITMVNVWGTWCPYCIEELPYFPELKNMLPANANLITICEDAEIEPELTKEILELTGANYTTLQADMELYEQLIGGLYAFPTTIFVNSKGEMVGGAIQGARTAEEYYAAIMLRLENM